MSPDPFSYCGEASDEKHCLERNGGEGKSSVAEEDRRDESGEEYLREGDDDEATPGRGYGSEQGSDEGEGEEARSEESCELAELQEQIALAIATWFDELSRSGLECPVGDIGWS